MPVIEVTTTSLSLNCAVLSNTTQESSCVLISIAVLHTAAKASQSGSIKFLTGVAGMDVDVLDKANQVNLKKFRCVLPFKVRG